MLTREHHDLIAIGDKLFSDRQGLVSTWQELADHFYPERADFTRPFESGGEYASNLDTSYPITARRDLADSFGAMLRRPGTNWFHIGVKRVQDIDEPGRKWLEMSERVLRRALYDIDSNFVRATKEGDNDFATFGQCVLSSELIFHPIRGAILLHRCWHIKDVVWCMDAFGKIGHVQRKWEATARDLVDTFGEKRVHPSVVKCLERDTYRGFDVRHIRVYSKDYGRNSRTPYTSIFIDVENQHLIEEVGLWTPYYVIPRWKTVSNSQYAHSPAAMSALPDARMLQQMTYTILTAGEYAIEPAMVGYPEAIKGPVEAFPGGFTALDAAYDEKLGEAIRPLMKGGERAIPLGLKMNQDTRMMIADAFYLTKLGLPQAGQGGMSPYEVKMRTDEFIRATLPLFEPMESEYNGAYMEQDFELLLRGGAMGSPDVIPDSLKGQETEFRFESPLRESIESLKGQQFIAALQLASQAAQADPMAPKQINWGLGHRDAQHGIGTPAAWMVDEEVVAAQAQAMMKEQQMAAMAQKVAAGAEIAQKVGDAGQSVRQMLTPDQPVEQAA